MNVVSVNVPASAVGSGVAQPMSSNSTQAASFYDNFVVCNPPAQVYIGGWVRTPAGTGTGVALGDLACLADERDDYDSVLADQLDQHCQRQYDPGHPGGHVQRRHAGAAATIAAGTWVENCHTFSYANTAVVAAGTYTGRVTYTLALP